MTLTQSCIAITLILVIGVCISTATQLTQTESSNQPELLQHSRLLLSSSTANPPPANSNLTRYGHKHLIPITPNDVGLCIAVAIALFIASGAGVGGGILVVPALLLIGGFGSVDGVGLSNITVLSLAVSTMCFQISRRHPARDAPLIDWDLVMLFGPPSVVGSISGSYINMIIPSWVTKVTLLLLLLPITWRMIDKARMLYRKESSAERKTATPAPAATAEGATVFDHNPLHRLSATVHNIADNSAAIPDMYGVELAYLSSEGLDTNHVDMHTIVAAEAVQGATVHQQQQVKAADSSTKHLELVAAAAVSDSDLKCKDTTPADFSDLESGRSDVAAAAIRPRWLNLGFSYVHDPDRAESVRAKITAEESAQLPVLQVGLLGLILASVMVTNITGGYLVQCGTYHYWLLVLTPLPLMLIIWGVIRHHVLWKVDSKRCLGMKQTADLKWNRKNTILYPLICISSGLIAGLLGLGGGLILTPLMLELGVHPAVSVASSQVTMLIGNSTSAIVYAVAGAIPWDYGATLVIVGFISALCGQIIVSWLVRWLGRSSPIVMILSIMFTLATGAALTVVVTTMIDIGKHPEKLTAHKAVCIR